MKNALTAEHITPIDRLTDTEVDAILSGRLPAPRYQPWAAIELKKPQSPRRCSHCKKLGHNRRECG